jgi:NADH-quinone oxidoreductase subunit G
MVKIEIDGKTLEVPQGQMVIEAADIAGIPIPRFCYHKKLSIAANCRMCLVDVANAPKALPACATPVTEGMKIYTKSKRAIDAQKAVMEFLLINHPLDCPICDQGGQCELQDVALEYGKDTSQFEERKRVVKDKDIGPLITTEMTRCIHCTRCVRFGAEVAGMREMGATGRGEFMQIGTYIEESVDSELSGNIIDLCPVGALTSKPFRFQARAWELQALPSVSPHDCLGSNLYFHVINHKVLRSLPRENEDLNEVWLSDRDRFSYLGFNHADRLTQPWIKKDNEWQAVDWATALQFTCDLLDKINSKDLGVLSSPNSTLEEFFLLQKLMRAKGCNNVDHRLRMGDKALQDKNPQLGISLKNLETQEVIVIVGSHLRKEQPLINARVRKAALHGAKVFAINPYRMDFNYTVHQITDSADILSSLNSELKALKDVLAQSQNVTFLIGDLAYSHPHAAAIHGIVQTFASKYNATLGEMRVGANASGGWIAGMLPYRTPTGNATHGLSAIEMLSKPMQGYFLLHTEPEFDSSQSGLALNALQAANAVIALTAFDSANLREYANVLLPVTPISETAGTYVNALGNWQSFEGAVRPLGESRPGWKVLRVLANVWDVPGFEYQSCIEVLQEIKDTYKAETQKAYAEMHTVTSEPKDLHRIAGVSLYHVDGVVRRSIALQETKDADVANVRINSATANQLGLKAGDSVIVSDSVGKTAAPLPVEIDDHIPNNAAYIAAGIPQTLALGAGYTSINLEPFKG